MTYAKLVSLRSFSLIPQDETSFGNKQAMRLEHAARDNKPPAPLEVGAEDDAGGGEG